jgi:ATP-dependent helicase STH1/SNF2
LEADQEEENEEAGDMNDDELNELIARSEDEGRLFRQLDIDRERKALEAWRAAGNRGKPPPSLMQLEELPECYQTDEPFDVKEAEEVIEGRGHRRKNVVSYNDGLSDDAWAMVSAVIVDFDSRLMIDRHWKMARICRRFLNGLRRRKSGGSPTNSSRKPKPLLVAHQYRMTVAAERLKRVRTK